MSQAAHNGRKPRVVALGTPKFVGDDYLAEFKKDFDYAVRISIPLLQQPVVKAIPSM